MFQYFLAFMLINSYYQSLGTPIQPNHLISESLSGLASECENSFLSNAIKGKIKECAISVPPYKKKQIQCLMFYDINRQLCSAVAASKVALNQEVAGKIMDKQDINTVCLQAKDWVFTNITEYPNYKNSSEALNKSPIICGDICAVEDTIEEANEFCKYFKWGTEVLKTQVATLASNVNNNGVDAPVIPEPESNLKADIAVPINNNPLSSQIGNTKTMNVQIKQTEAAIVKTTPDKTEADSGDVAVAIQKSTVQATSVKQPTSQDIQPGDKLDDADVNVNALEHPIDLPSDQANKSTVTSDIKPEGENDPIVLPESGKDLPLHMDTKDAVLEKAEGKAPNDGDDYPDSEGNDGGDDDGDDQGLDIKTGQETKPEIKSRLTPSQNNDISQKDYYHNTINDGFPEDSDHFFPFFLTAIILVVLLYVLYHNKSKVSKVFFGLILEGRQGGRRRNSRGHAYRRLDTLEQAMSANTTAPPSKIIY